VAHVGTDGTRSSFSFTVANAESVFNSGNNAFSNIGGPIATGSSGVASFDWGVPFFYGRNIYTAIDGAKTPAGAGPYWAY
jgi:hypothetical protein